MKILRQKEFGLFSIFKKSPKVVVEKKVVNYEFPTIADLQKSNSSLAQGLRATDRILKDQRFIDSLKNISNLLGYEIPLYAKTWISLEEKEKKEQERILGYEIEAEDESVNDYVPLMHINFGGYGEAETLYLYNMSNNRVYFCGWDDFDYYNKPMSIKDIMTAEIEYLVDRINDELYPHSEDESEDDYRKAMSELKNLKRLLWIK